MENSEFQRRFLFGLVHDCYEFQDNNTDFLSVGSTVPGRIRRWLRDKSLLFAKKTGFTRRNFPIENASEHLMYTLSNIDRLENFYHLLGDNYSKQLLIELLKYRILGAQHVKLPVNNKGYWDKYTSINKSFLQERCTIKTGNRYLNRYKLRDLNTSIDLHAHPLNILNTFLLEQYAYQKDSRIIKVKPGDVVIDGGGCWGDVAFYFASKVGKQGKVYCFEFVQDNLEILQKNLSLNPHLAERIEVVPNALWVKSKEIVSYCPRGPSTSLESRKKHSDSLEVSTLSIDDFVNKEEIKKIDYIKFDIEGSELKALQGAEDTICAFRPKLAIALYHRQNDFILIPDYLAKLGLKYRFFLDHFTLHLQETVLFASPAVDSEFD